MAEPFQQRPQETIAGPAKSACRDQIEHLLAEAESVRSVSAREVAEIGARHGLNLGRQLAVARRELYRRFLEHCFLDFKVSSEESADILHLREILHMAKWEASEIQDEVVKRVYGRALENVLEDGELDPEEENFIRRLREDLEIPLVTAEGMLQKAWRTTRQRGPRQGPAGAHPLVGSSESSFEDAAQRALHAGEAGAPPLTHGRFSLVDAQVEVREGKPALFWVALAPVERAET